MKKLIFIYYLPLTKKIEKDFYIKELLEGEINVEYWDVTDIFFKDLVWEGRVTRDYIRKLNSYKELKRALKAENIKDCIFHIQVTFEKRVYKLFSILSKNSCRITYFARGSLPSSQSESVAAEESTDTTKVSYLDKVLKYLKNPLRIGNYVSFKVRMLLLSFRERYQDSIRSYYTVFCAGQKTLISYKETSKAIPINYFDYDDYLVARHKRDRVVEGRYCVFLDQYLPFHPDFKIVNKETLEPERYFALLNKYFDYLEVTYDLKVVIAAHPKSNYSKETFGGRKIVKYLTNELSRDCEFAIAHFSTAISFPIFYNKPIMFIYTDEFIKLYSTSYMKTVNCWASILNSSLYNIEELNNIESKIPEVDHMKYERCKYEYFTSSEVDGSLTKDILLSFYKREL